MAESGTATHLEHWKRVHEVWVNVPSTGYVGVGKVVDPVCKVDAFTVAHDGEQILIGEAPVNADVLHDIEDDDCAEYFVRVEWIKTVPLSEAVKETGFFGNQNSAARPVAAKWRHTVDRLKKRFGIN